MLRYESRRWQHAINRNLILVEEPGQGDLATKQTFISAWTHPQEAGGGTNMRSSTHADTVFLSVTARLAQLAKLQALNLMVVCSSPTVSAIENYVGVCTGP